MATIEDARLLIEISRWAHDFGVYENREWVQMHLDELKSFEGFEQRYPPGTPDHLRPFTVLGYFENIGLFRKHRVIDEDLLFDWLDFMSEWERMAAFAVAHREAASLADAWKNFELLAVDQRRYYEQQAKRCDESSDST